MADIVWNPGLSLGVAPIDEEHKQLIVYANALLHSVRSQDDKAITAAFIQLRTYTVTHFANEEEYMRKVHYPDTNKHAEQHAELKQRVKVYQDTLFHRGEIHEKDVVEFLKQWLIEHVLRTDMKIKEFLATKQG